MARTVQFYLDYVSPFAYLASTQFAGLGLDIDYRPIDIFDVMRRVGNQPSTRCAAKARYGLADAARWATRYGAAIWRRAERPDIGVALDHNGTEAAGIGVFGVPAFVVDGELFFGNDRLDFVRERAA